MSDGSSEPVPPWMGGRTRTVNQVVNRSTAPDPDTPAPLDPGAVLDAVRRMSEAQRRELAVLIGEAVGLLALPPFRAGEVPPEVAQAPAHLKQHNPVW